MFEDPAVEGFSTARVLLTCWSLFFFFVVIATPERLTPEFYSLYNTVLLTLTAWAGGSKMVASFTANRTSTVKDDVVASTDIQEFQEKG